MRWRQLPPLKTATWFKVIRIVLLANMHRKMAAGGINHRRPHREMRARSRMQRGQSRPCPSQVSHLSGLSRRQFSLSRRHWHHAAPSPKGAAESRRLFGAVPMNG